MTRLRYAFRALARTPLVTSVVVLSLGLGIGVNTAIFSMLYQMVLRALPVERPEELVILTTPAEFKGGRTSTDDAGDMESVFSYRVVRQLEAHPEGTAGIAGFRSIGANLAFENQTVSGSAMLVSGGYFPLLGVTPAFGRTIGPEDDRDGNGNPVAFLGYGYWKDRLGGNQAILNRPLRVNGQVLTIVGVAPRTFSGTVIGNEPDVFVPMALKPQLTPGWDGRDRYDDYWVYAYARLKPGTTREQAQAALNTVYAGIVEDQAKVIQHGRGADFTKRFLASRITLRDGKLGQSSMRTETRLPLLILMGATGLVLLIAMANAANLMLARSAQRRKELAIRAALGAGQREIMGQMLVEALLMSAAGGLAGVLLGKWTIQLVFATMMDAESPMYSLGASLHWPVLLFSLALGLASGVIFGLYPAWEAARSSVASTLKEAAGQTTASGGSARMRKALVCGQVAISTVLLVPTGLFLQSLVNLLRADLGVRTENVVTFGVSPDLNGYQTDRVRTLMERTERELAAVPGVRSVAASMVPLIAGSNWGSNLTVEGFPVDPNAPETTHSMLNVVGPGFFGKMGVPLISGREFTEADTLAGPKVAVVNESFARHFFGDRSPLGRRFTQGWGKVQPDIEIVGVVKDSVYSGVKRKIPRLFITPYRQNRDLGQMHFYVTSALPPAQIIPQIRKTMAAIDANLPLRNLRTFEDQVKRNIQGDRVTFQLAGIFAALATVLAMLGLYGVMAYTVTRRTREIGIRIALGAGSAGIRGMVMREMLLILAVGLMLGVPAALALARLTESQLFGVKAFDPLVVSAAVCALAVASLAAAYLPARRATRVNPVEALRQE